MLYMIQWRCQSHFIECSPETVEFMKSHCDQADDEAVKTDPPEYDRTPHRFMAVPVQLSDADMFMSQLT